MSFKETFNLRATSENILRTTIIIIVSLTNFHRGLTTYVEMNIVHGNEKFPKGIKLRNYLSENTPAEPFLPTSKYTIESRNAQNYVSYQTGINNLNEEGDTKQIDDLRKQNIDVQPYIKKPKILLTRTNLDIIHQNQMTNSYTNNNSIETAIKPAYYTPMRFVTGNTTVITTQSGATAHISCIVYHLGECVVSWIRRKDYHLLTVGLTAYSSDERFSATHLKHSEDWALQIKFVQERDSGVYECQVSTHPPTSMFFNLSVVEARTQIAGPNIRYQTPDSTLRLHCHVIKNTEKSEFLFWYHENRMINYDADRGINVSTAPDFLSSELIISRTRRDHSGNYTCVASNTQPDSVLIHIFKGDNPAAMYHEHVGSSYQMQRFNIAMTAITLICSSFLV